LIKTYRQHREQIHAGQILSIGTARSPDSAPPGTGWTGFQSLQDDRGYAIVYREWTSRDQEVLKLWCMANTRVRFERIAGAGADFEETIGEQGAITFRLPKPFSFVLYRYRVMSHFSPQKNES
jgi:hypothetical protein